MAYKSRRGSRWYVYIRAEEGGKPRIWTGDDREGRSFVREEDAEAERLHAEVVAETWRRLPATPSLSALKEFLSARQVAADTRKSYDDILRPFLTWMGALPLREYRARDLERYLAERTGWGPRRAAMLIQVARVFVRWCEKRRLPCSDFAVHVEIPRQDTRERRPRTPEEAEAVLMKAVEERHPFVLPIALARYAGLSYGDLWRLTWEEVELGAVPPVIRHVRHKTRRGKPIPICAPLHDLLTRYRDAVSGSVCRHLKPGLKGYDQRQLHALERRAKVAVEKGDGWHSLRHCFGTELERAGATRSAIQDAMQHARGSRETDRYCHARESDVARFIERASARATASS